MCTTSFYSRFRIWVRPLLIISYVLFVIIVLPWLIVRSVKDGFRTKDQLVLIGGLFVIAALPICFWHISQHIGKHETPSTRLLDYLHFRCAGLHCFVISGDVASSKPYQFSDDSFYLHPPTQLVYVVVWLVGQGLAPQSFCFVP